MIKIVPESGFCHGVSAAVRRADGLIPQLSSGEKVYLFGDLVNNQNVMARLRSKGFIVAQSAKDVASGAVAVIRAHGTPHGVFEELARKNVEIIDCTCAKVKSIHKIVAEKSCRVVIIGKKNHPEVLGILARCGDGVVAENEAELAAAISASKICVVAQTTCNKAWFEKAVAIVKAKRPDAEIFDTLCDVTAKRMENAVKLAKNADCMVVVGDKKSANSVGLFEACKTACVKVFFVSSAEELAENASEIAACEAIGIAGSASAPAETIEEIHNYLLFAKFLAQAKAEIENDCEQYFLELQNAAKDKPFIGDALRDFHRQNQGGKRVRGALIKLGAQIMGLNSRGVMSVAMAYEIFATAILIHDDIIDNSPTRRGKPTIHAGESDSLFGIGRAICIGDCGLFLATKILANSGLDAAVFSKIVSLFADIQIKTLEGEIMDISLPKNPPDADNYRRAVYEIYEFKTAWYTLAGPLMLGAICGGADEETLGILREIALPLGFAFQIKDDLLGVFADEKILGKPALSDIIEKKQTILYGYALKHCTEEQKISLEAHYGNPDADEKSLEIIRAIFAESGAKSYAEAEISRFSNIALEKINYFDNETAQLLRGLVCFLTSRRF